MAPVTFRLATPADAHALAALRYAMEVERHPDHAHLMPLATYQEAFAAAVAPEIAADRYRAWLAEAEGQVVACAVLIVSVMVPNLRTLRRRRAHVSSVYTRPEWRRRGLARALMERLLADARALGVQRALLYASEMGRPLYESLGFAPSRGMDFDLEE